MADLVQYYGTGRRKSAIARVFLRPGTGAWKVNDKEFDVALHIYFKDKAAHDQYQDAPRHKQFIQENMANWSKVRVFDSYVEK